MNPGAIHLALIYAAVAILATIGCLLAYAGERSRDIDEHTDWHSERPGRPCPWCEAADPQPDLDRRITEARRSDQEAFNEAFGLGER